MTPRKKLGHARVRTFEWVPYLSSYIYSLKERETPGIGTAAIDDAGNLYWDPDFITKCDLDQGAYLVTHEVLHLIFEHHARSKEMVPNPTPQQQFILNIAADLVIEQTLAHMRHVRPEGAVHLGVVVPQLGNLLLDFPPNRSMQEYYRLIIEKLKGNESTDGNAGSSNQNAGRQPQGNDDDVAEEEDDTDTNDPEDEPEDEDDEWNDEQDDMDEQWEESGCPPAEQIVDLDDLYYENGWRPPASGYDEDEPDPEAYDEDEDDGNDSGGSESPTSSIGKPGSPGSGGSCADGVPRKYEVSSDGSWETYGQDVAAAGVEKYEKENPGSVPGSIKAAIRSRLHPTPDPFAQLRSAVCTSAASPVGGRDFSHRRRSKKQLPGDDQPLLHGRITVQPHAVVIVDTSGSMMTVDVQVKALSVIAQGLRKLGRVKVYCADTKVQSHASVSSVRTFDWHGGGGTDMAAALLEVDQNDRPDSIVLITDAQTYWKPEKPRARVVVAYTGTGGSHWHKAIPSWCRTVSLTKES